MIHTVLIKSGSFVFDVNQGDTIAFHRGDQVIARVVMRKEDNQVFVPDNDRTIPISLDDVVGKMIRGIPGN